MNIELSPHELRVVGCLIEKQLTTPELYPLSLNALTNACNQKSNRDPVMELTEAQVQAAVDALSRKHLILERSGFGSRVPKYQQRFCNTEFSVFQFTPQERALICELMLRGAQTPGELRTRAARLAPFAAVQEVEQALEALAQRPGGALVRREALEPGRREARYRHLFAHPEAPSAEPTPETAATAPVAHPDWAERLARIEQELSELREQIAELKRRG